MFYNASPKIFERAKSLRENMTRAESILWEALKGKKISGLRFRRQHPIGKYIADFYCHPIKLVIEIDGEIHNSRENKDYDIGREADLSSLGIKVIHFTNSQVENDLDNVLILIKQISESRLLELKSPLQGI